MEISKTQEFEKWFNEESTKSKGQIIARLTRIQVYDHFGDYKLLGNDLLELRWKAGKRIYFSIFQDKEKMVLLLLGGYKNGQKKDIKKAKALITKYKKT
ncbi:MAG: hypothetical protein K940chlam5_00483 [Candidatus Anoxychlamydiales bacterium]|nr:hypothetical protein [Candidatus Anoxychlamydiales bacterium]